MIEPVGIERIMLQHVVVGVGIYTVTVAAGLRWVVHSIIGTGNMSDGTNGGAVILHLHGCEVAAFDINFGLIDTTLEFPTFTNAGVPLIAGDEISVTVAVLPPFVSAVPTVDFMVYGLEYCDPATAP
jgi:hypothetical protein